MTLLLDKRSGVMGERPTIYVVMTSEPDAELLGASPVRETAAELAKECGAVVVAVPRVTPSGVVSAIQELGAMARGEDPDEDGWRDYDHGFRDGYQAALRERRAEIEALLPKVYDGTHLTDCPYVDVLMQIREALAPGQSEIR